MPTIRRLAYSAGSIVPSCALLPPPVAAPASMTSNVGDENGFVDPGSAARPVEDADGERADLEQLRPVLGAARRCHDLEVEAARRAPRSTVIAPATDAVAGRGAARGLGGRGARTRTARARPRSVGVGVEERVQRRDRPRPPAPRPRTRPRSGSRVARSTSADAERDERDHDREARQEQRREQERPRADPLAVLAPRDERRVAGRRRIRSVRPTRLAVDAVTPRPRRSRRAPSAHRPRPGRRQRGGCPRRPVGPRGR